LRGGALMCSEAISRPRRFRHLVDGAVERGFVGARRLGRSAQLAHELQRRRADLVFRGRRLEVRQRP
jgi:hypothetical protein